MARIFFQLSTCFGSENDWIRNERHLVSNQNLTWVTAKQLAQLKLDWAREIAIIGSNQIQP